MVTNNESFTLIRVITPRNISNDNPPDEIIKIIGDQNPTISPNAPNNSNTAVRVPTFSRLNRLNSSFILLDVK